MSEFADGDQSAIVAGLNNKAIYDCTLRIPYPYLMDHANAWIDSVVKQTASAECVTHFAIRNESEYLIGGFSFEPPRPDHPRRSEIGYWLAESYWNRGLMSQIVARMCDYGFQKLQLLKIVAGVFASNPASARVLEKCGFVLEGKLSKQYLKDGKELDALLFGRTR